ncbi:MAG TPA: DUF1003 domain-containing protein [Gaiellaceae bacterium]
MAARSNPHSPLSPSNPGPPHNPVLIQHAEQRASHLQARIADTITKFAGSMAFVYVHVLWFAVWIGLRIEKFPFGLLTMIVSLEAIFLSTFVMISQNRADEKRQVLADQQWHMVNTEEKQNEELLTISNEILALTRDVHQLTIPGRK